MVQYDFGKMQASIEEKEREVKELERELAHQKEISSEKKNNQNKDIIELEKKIEGLKYLYIYTGILLRNKKRRYKGWRPRRRHRPRLQSTASIRSWSKKKKNTKTWDWKLKGHRNRQNKCVKTPQNQQPRTPAVRSCDSPFDLFQTINE